MDDEEYIPPPPSPSSHCSDTIKPNKKRKRSASINLPPITICVINPFEEEELEEDYAEEIEVTDEIQDLLINTDREVSKINNNGLNCYHIRDQILLSKLDLNTKAILISKFDQQTDKSDKSKLNTWISEILKLPIGIYKPIVDDYNNFDFNSFLMTARHKLDNVVYGMENTKEEIIDFLVKLLLHPNKTGTVIGLKGPKGVGKTRLCRALSEILNLPLFQISMGGLTDSSVLLGHDSTYIGSKCGRIASIIQQAKCMNFILYIDELDKCGSDGKAKDVQGVLTHLLDETQNTHFQDLYFEGINLDLSKVLFITSFNETEDVDPIVLNRMKILEIQELSTDDKIIIVKNYILPEINYNNFHISDEVIRYIITNKTEPEPGMRNINKNIDTIINRLNTYFVLTVCKDSNKIIDKFSYQNLKINVDNKGQFIITENVIDVLLSKRKVCDESWRTMYV